LAETVRLVQTHIVGYSVLGYGLLLLATVFAFVPAISGRIALPVYARGSGIYFCAIGAAILAFRWPIVFMNDAIQGDESALIVMAHSALRNPVPWESFDGSTSGPLNVLVLAPVVKVFAAQPYLGSRLLVCALVVLGLFFVYRSVQLLYGELAGRVAILPALAFFCVATSYDLTPYTSEAISSVLVAGAGLLVVRLATQSTRTPFRLFFGGLLAGLLPFSKLQTAPIALALLVLFAIAVWNDTNRRARSTILLVSGAAAPGMLLAGVLWLRGDLWNAYVSYILQSSAYVSGSKEVAGYWWYALLLYPWTGPLFCVLFVAALLLRQRANAAVQERAASGTPLSPAARYAPRAAAFVTAAAFVSIAAPGFWWQHYLLLAVLPLTALAGCLLGQVLAAPPASIGRPSMRWIAAVAGIYAIATMSPVVVERIFTSDPAMWKMAHPYAYRKPEVVAAILRVTRPGDAMSVWGFMPDFYIVAGARDATENAHTPFQIAPGPYRGYFRERYLNELRNASPQIFIDAAGPGAFLAGGPMQDGIRSFPELESFVRTNYCGPLLAGGMMIYVLRSVARERGACS
jgi:hypothetical protein